MCATNKLRKCNVRKFNVRKEWLLTKLTIFVKLKFLTFLSLFHHFFSFLLTFWFIVCIIDIMFGFS